MPSSSLRRWNARKSEHCRPFDVDHLDELAVPHLVRERRRPVDAEVEPRFGERRRQLHLLVARAIVRRTSTTRSDGGGAPSTTRPAGAATTTTTVRSATNDVEAPATPTRRTAGWPWPRRISPRRPSSPPPQRAGGRRRHERAEHGGRRVGDGAERVRGVRRRRPRAWWSRRVAPVDVGDRDPVVRPTATRWRRPVAPSRSRGTDRRGGTRRSAARDAPVSTAMGRSLGRRRRARLLLVGLARPAARASSRLPVASSFLTSFSTARRLYDWFQ